MKTKELTVNIFKVKVNPTQEEFFNRKRFNLYKYIYWSTNRIIYFHWIQEKYSYFLVFDEKLIINDNTILFSLCEGRMKSIPGLTFLGEYTLRIPMPGLELDKPYLNNQGKFITCSGLEIGSFISFFEIEEERGINILLEKLAVYIMTLI
jgi:hypothetical protein